MTGYGHRNVQTPIKRELHLDLCPRLMYTFIVADNRWAARLPRHGAGGHEPNMCFDDLLIPLAQRPKINKQSKLTDNIIIGLTTATCLSLAFSRTSL
ncbi:jg5270 [Pararge aegeria aegeria]|uniref:Jg5270 protein n=1 Tax=Pararge aegeria aegeria TaxID=348720 RepID=A0A8S4RMZ7_9NEOP|nr:jg5270 [Pararge aegeria aegeria]